MGTVNTDDAVTINIYTAIIFAQTLELSYFTKRLFDYACFHSKLNMMCHDINDHKRLRETISTGEQCLFSVLLV